MPTGYTADIKDGISFEQFVMNCARAFGALMDMRDLPASAPIPERFEPSSYHMDKLADARRQLAHYEGMSAEDVLEVSAAEYQEEEQHRKQRLQENKKTLEGYLGMLDQVRLWVVPTEEHAGLKEFMIKQLEESIRWDDSTEYLSTPTPKILGTEWLEGKKSKALSDIAYHKKHYEAEVKRTEQRNAWISALRASLNPA